LKTGKKRIILASSSPRRINLLKKLRIPFKLAKPRVKEGLTSTANDPVGLVIKRAKLKAQSVKREPKSVIISADTIVMVDNEILGKPRSIKEAKLMISKLSGKWHKVYTGLAVLDTETGKTFTDYAETKVKFKKLNDEEIDFYLKTKEPMDKAGAYAIQGYASLFIEELEGCYYNVMGLPLNKLYKLLKGAGVDLLEYINHPTRSSVV